MDQLQKEHERLWKRLKSSKNIKDVQATIDMLQEARDTIAAGKLFDSFSPSIRERLRKLLTEFG